MKSLFKSVLISILVVLVAAAGYGAALWAGWLPIPRVVTEQVAKLKHLTPQQAQTLDRLASLWTTLKASRDAALVDHAIALGTSRDNTAALWKFAQEHYPQLHPETLESIKVQLKMDDADFERAKNLVASALEAYSRTGKSEVPAGEREQWARLNEKYQVLELIESLK